VALRCAKNVKTTRLRAAVLENVFGATEPLLASRTDGLVGCVPGGGVTIAA